MTVDKSSKTHRHLVRLRRVVRGERGAYENELAVLPHIALRHCECVDDGVTGHWVDPSIHAARKEKGHLPQKPLSIFLSFLSLSLPPSLSANAKRPQSPQSERASEYVSAAALMFKTDQRRLTPPPPILSPPFFPFRFVFEEWMGRTDDMEGQLPLLQASPSPMSIAINPRKLFRAPHPRSLSPPTQLQ